MFRSGRVLLFMLAASMAVSKFASAQTPTDSSFSLLFNTYYSFTRADDPHINRWLSKYGYPTEPHTPASINFEVSAIPTGSRFMYNLRLSTIVTAKNLSSFDIMGGLYRAIIKKKSLLLLAGAGFGYHADIVNLDGQLPPEYKAIATQYRRQLVLRRTGLVAEPAVRAYWYPVHMGSKLQIGLYAAVGYAMDFNSHWHLGYYDDNHGNKYAHFRRITKPSDQFQVSEYGFSYNGGVSFRLTLF